YQSRAFDRPNAYIKKSNGELDERFTIPKTKPDYYHSAVDRFFLEKGVLHPDLANTTIKDRCDGAQKIIEQNAERMAKIIEAYPELGETKKDPKTGEDLKDPDTGGPLALFDWINDPRIPASQHPGRLQQAMQEGLLDV